MSSMLFLHPTYLLATVSLAFIVGTRHCVEGRVLCTTAPPPMSAGADNQAQPLGSLSHAEPIVPWFNAPCQHELRFKRSSASFQEASAHCHLIHKELALIANDSLAMNAVRHLKAHVSGHFNTQPVDRDHYPDIFALVPGREGPTWNGLIASTWKASFAFASLLSDSIQEETADQQRTDTYPRDALNLLVSICTNSYLSYVTLERYGL